VELSSRNDFAIPLGKEYAGLPRVANFPVAHELAGLTVRTGDLRWSIRVDIRSAGNIWQRQEVDYA
jgi:hypothetical protein